MGLKRNYEPSISKQFFPAPLFAFISICSFEYLLSVSVEWFTKKLSNIHFLQCHYYLRFFQLIKYVILAKQVTVNYPPKNQIGYSDEQNIEINESGTKFYVERKHMSLQYVFSCWCPKDCFMQDLTWKVWYF